MKNKVKQIDISLAVALIVDRSTIFYLLKEVISNYSKLTRKKHSKADNRRKTKYETIGSSQKRMRNILLDATAMIKSGFLLEAIREEDREEYKEIAKTELNTFFKRRIIW